ncbi:metallophosphoesterase [Vibrio lentus]
MLQTLILRFRDLITLPGKTIEQHKEVISKKGHVYWGWWAKPNETLPKVFYDNHAKVKPFSHPIYLFDTGQQMLYQAELESIHTGPGGSPFPCPNDRVGDELALPDYYKEDRPCPTWFKITSIEPVKGDVLELLHEWSYCAENYGLFGDNQRAFADFFNKQVSSLEELVHQERTVWFVQNYMQEHSKKEIVLLNANVAVPEDFSSNFIKLKGSKIHWLTDIHFDNDNRFHAFSNADASDSLQEIISSSFPTLESLIVSGDMTWASTAEEFCQVEDFYNYLISKTNLDSSKLGFCPGNHDVVFSKSKSAELIAALEKLHKVHLYKEDQETEEKQPKLSGEEINALKVENLPETAKENYVKHFRSVTSAPVNDYLSMGKKYLVENQRPVEICFLNSNTKEQYRYLFQGQGFIGQEQRKYAEENMGWKGVKKAFGAIRIVVMHHNLIPTEFVRIPHMGLSGSHVYDAQATIKWCMRNDVDVILHGHTHERSVIKMEQLIQGKMKSVWVVGLGSSGVNSGHRVPDHPNQCAELDFSEEKIKIQFYDIVDGVCSVSTDIKLS